MGLLFPIYGKPEIWEIWENLGKNKINLITVGKPMGFDGTNYEKNPGYVMLFGALSVPLEVIRMFRWRKNKKILQIFKIENKSIEC